MPKTGRDAIEQVISRESARHFFNAPVVAFLLSVVSIFIVKMSAIAVARAHRPSGSSASQLPMRTREFHDGSHARPQTPSCGQAASDHAIHVRHEVESLSGAV